MSPPCPDPYVERLLEGVAYLGARTRLKLDYESTRHVRLLLDALYPDLAAPAPAMGLARLDPGPQVNAMTGGHLVPRGTKLAAGLIPGTSTRATYTTAQDVHLWPVVVEQATYLPDRGALNAAQLPVAAVSGSEAGIQLKLSRRDGGPMRDLTLDQIDFFLGGGSLGGNLFDAIFGWGKNAVARADARDAGCHAANAAQMIGVHEDEALLPRVRSSFEGYRLLREYFLLPERFHFARLSGLSSAIREANGQSLEIVIPLTRPQPGLVGISHKDFVTSVTPIVNLFERECNLVDLDPRRSSHVVHVDKTRPRDFEIYRLIRVADAGQEDDRGKVSDLYSLEHRRGRSFVYTAERRRRRPSPDETEAGEMRTNSYPGDDLYISISRPPGAANLPSIERLDIRALCTNRDLPIRDELPKLSLESGDPVSDVSIIRSLKTPQPSLSSQMQEAGSGEAVPDDLTWRWIAQLSLSQLCLSEDGAKPLQALLQLYADRGDPKLERHARSITAVKAQSVVDRVDLPGPLCYAHGTEITFDVDEALLSGGSRLLLTGLLSRLLTREAAINSFVKARTRLISDQEHITWHHSVGARGLI